MKLSSAVLYIGGLLSSVILPEGLSGHLTLGQTKMPMNSRPLFAKTIKTQGLNWHSPQFQHKFFKIPQFPSNMWCQSLMFLYICKIMGFGNSEL